MPDFPGIAFQIPHGNISTFSESAMTGQAAITMNVTANAATWPATNRALYIPVQIDVPVTIVSIAFLVGTQSGNCDVGIYDEHGNRIVSKGSTAVGAAGVQNIDITDTALNPGTYFLAMCVDNTVAAFTAATLLGVVAQTCGMQQQAVGAVTLPDPATFANPVSSYLPLLVAVLAAVI